MESGRQTIIVLGLVLLLAAVVWLLYGCALGHHASLTTSQPAGISQQTGAANVHWTSNLPIGVVAVLWLVVVFLVVVAIFGSRGQTSMFKRVIELLSQVIEFSHLREMTRLERKPRE